MFDGCPVCCKGQRRVKIRPLAGYQVRYAATDNGVGVSHNQLEPLSHPSKERPVAKEV